MCPSIWHFHYTKNTLCFSYSFPVPSTLASTDLFTVSIVLPFQACCIVGLRQYVAFFRLTISLGKPVLEKAEEQEIKLPTSAGSWKKQESPRKASISALLTMPKPLTAWIKRNWKILQEMGIPEHLICPLRNLYAGQEATVRTGHGTLGEFKIGKGVCQGCILSPCLFNVYPEYIM